jgi:hypothetical protein
MNKEKFSRSERTYLLKQAGLLISLKNMELGITSLQSLYKSKHNYYCLYERPSELTLTDYLLSLQQPMSLNQIYKIAHDLFSSAQ